ncbi:neuronal acetylcholine receptor subunit alpha-7-like isoform X2 [Brevipalpus obovatus]|uniref:neuronal acetylcholine receptor subunit alpha-7-like isoform X2 n=1 Tax=Brevipalpus obovatus TaxID=246614 RepID=UPI003D9F904A
MIIIMPLIYSPLFLLAFFVSVSEQGENERRLLKNLLADYDPLERPVVNETEPVFVSMAFTLTQIIDVEWVDTNLRWDPSQYGGITEIRIPVEKMWKPDILLYNSADERIDSAFPVKVEVRNNGSCKWMPPGIYKSTCKIDIQWFPFDDQICMMKFGSWTYTLDALDLQLTSDEGDLSEFTPNGEWILLGMPLQRNTTKYDCCPKTYVDLKLFIMIRRRTLYYGFNLIVPCMIISSMVLLGFTTPPDCGEKLTLGVTILLSMSVFMLQLTDILPPTSESVSIIGTYFACIMMVVACSVVMTVVVLNFHHTSQESNEMNIWVKTIILSWLASILRMERPNQPQAPKRQEASPSRKSNQKSSPTIKEEISNINGQLKEYTDLMDRPIHVDFEEDFMQMHHLRSSNRHAYPYNNCCAHLGGVGSTSCGANSGSGHHSQFSSHMNQVFPHRSYPHIAPGEPASMGCCPVEMNTEPIGNVMRGSCASSSVNPPCKSCISLVNEINSIIREMCFITNRMRKDDEIQDIIQEWKFAGMVIDRLCLILFTAFTIISTVICLAQAPHLLV